MLGQDTRAPRLPGAPKPTDNPHAVRREGAPEAGEVRQSGVGQEGGVVAPAVVVDGER